jgi:hypothetical protein
LVSIHSGLDFTVTELVISMSGVANVADIRGVKHSGSPKLVTLNLSARIGIPVQLFLGVFQGLRGGVTIGNTTRLVHFGDVEPETSHS